MIEVNLLPGGKKGSSGGGFSFSLPKLGEMFRRGGGGGRMPGDPYLMFLVGAIVVSVAYLGWSFWSVNSQAEELQVRLDEQLQDSMTFAATIERAAQLEARADSIGRRVAIIQEIDAGRYVWPHLLDEIGAAVPDYTWLREVQYQGDNPLTVRIMGRAGSIFAITNFMRRLEASRFLRNVNTETIQQVPSEENPDDRVQEFEFVMTYDPPPMDELQTVPLFGDASAQSSGNVGGN